MRWLLLVMLVGCGGTEPKPKTLADYCPRTCKDIQAEVHPAATCEWTTMATCRIEGDPAVGVTACSDLVPGSGDYVCLDNTGTACLEESATINCGP